MTKVLTWTAAWLLPLATMADIPAATRFYRYKRVGYEILPDANALASKSAWELDLLTVVGFLLIGLFLCLCARKTWRVKICFWIPVCVIAVFALIIRTFHYLIAGVSVLLLLDILIEFDTLKKGADFVLPLVCLCMMALTIIPVVFHRRIEKQFPALFGRKIGIASFICAGIVMAWFVWWLYGELTRVESLGVIYDPAPGWKYPMEISEKERANFESRQHSLPSRMQEMIETEWIANRTNGSEYHAKSVVLGILKRDSELRSACKGIPLELIISHYFTTPNWVDYSSFMYPRTVSWVDLMESLKANSNNRDEESQTETFR